MDHLSADAHAAVLRGVEWLNEQAQEAIIPLYWWDFVDLNELEMSNVNNCILGQLFEGRGHYSGYDYVVENMFDDNQYVTESYGFTVTYGRDYSFYTLHAVWAGTIERLREQHRNP